MSDNNFNYTISIKKIEKIQAKLEDKGLIIDSQYNIVDVIGKLGYENVILKYSPFFYDSFQNYKIGTKLSDIVDLFFFDLDLRKEVFSIMQLFELRLKSAMIEIISSYISPNYNNYVKSGNFEEKYEYKNKKGEVLFKTTRKWLRKRLKQYRNKLNREPKVAEIIPKLYFHEIEDWYCLLREDLKYKVALYMKFGPGFEVFQSKINVEEATVFLLPMINLYRGYRNQAAHEGIIFNYYDPELRFPYTAYYNGQKLIPSDRQYHCGIGILLLLSYLLDPDFLFKRFDASLEILIRNYLMNHPDQKDIIKEMGLDRVHILTKDKKYIEF
ncbi:Abi family protein [Lactobacillus rodentium]|uniref:Abortive infection bacteriophage resistance protein n=1 Tax=Lactobacillus rodentium TaxID=947835 RepID=A0A2Z6TTF8_9LACO|nr:Abi family protein [Lactobacillus rodentium]MCR1894751.1 Abi family protein [Lactobacillus rodentium]GBG04999.1 hypothetical protein LrDSM24759_09130 [Lactobacillus rodentium]